MFAASLFDHPGDLLADGQAGRCRGTWRIQDVDGAGTLDDVEILDQLPVAAHRLRPIQLPVFQFLAKLHGFTATRPSYMVVVAEALADAGTSCPVSRVETTMEWE